MPLEVGRPSSRRLASDLIATLQGRFPRTAMAVAAAQMALPAASWARDQVHERTTFTVKVPGTDDIYDDLHGWVLGLLPESRQRALVAWSTRRGSDIGEAVAVPGSGLPAHRRPPQLRLHYDGSREQEIRVDGYRIRVQVSDVARTEDGRSLKPPEITFTASSAAARDALLEAMAQVLADSHEARSRPSFRMLDQWDDWVRLETLAPRTLESVVLPAGQIERIVADVGTFLDGEGDYVRRCIPWHRGHLYEGPPGTGKTSVARAVAAHFGMDVWYLPLADVKRDGSLLRTITHIAPRSMLLLEDVDVFHAAKERDDDNGLTLSGVLNALDGLATPHGLLTVMTTNTPEVLDPAVVRPGRVDLTEHFGLADEEMAERLISRYYGEPLASAYGILPCAPADVVEACKRSAGPAEAIERLVAGPAKMRA